MPKDRMSIFLAPGNLPAVLGQMRGKTVFELQGVNQETGEILLVGIHNGKQIGLDLKLEGDGFTCMMNIPVPGSK